jgi:hypothetical protein
MNKPTQAFSLKHLEKIAVELDFLQKPFLGPIFIPPVQID